MDTLFLKIVNMSIAASWLILAVILVRVLLKRAPKWIHVLAWGIVAVRLICPLTLESALSLIPSSETIPLGIGMDPAPAIQSGIPALNEAINPIISQSSMPVPAASANPLQILIGIGGYIWIFGMIGMLLYGAGSFVFLRLKVRASFYLEDRIWLCDEIHTPFILGCFRPRIYIPSGIEEKQLPHILAHEKAHLKRHDHWWKPLGYLILAIHWFNPLVWAAYILLCRDIELACDEKVIKNLGKEGSIAYSQALLACSISRRTILVCPLAFGEVGVKERVKRVLTYKRPAFWLVLLAALASIVLAVCFLTNPSHIGLTSGTIDQVDMHAATENLHSMTVRDDGEWITCNEGERNRFLSVMDKIEIRREIISRSRSEERDQSFTIELNGNLSLHFSGDFSELWLDDGVKPSFTYQIANPDQAKELLLNFTLVRDGAFRIADQWFDYLETPDQMPKDPMTMEISEFPGVTFRCSGYQMKAVADGVSTVLYTGMPIWNTYVYDLTGDEKPDLCSTISWGSGMIDTRILVYDYANGACYELSDRGNYDFRLRLNEQDGKLYIEKTEYWTNELVQSGRLIFKDHTIQIDGNIQEIGKENFSERADRLLGFICRSSNLSSNHHVYIHNAQKEYDELLGYGEATLQYCFRQFLEGSQTDLKGLIMAELCRDIMEKQFGMDKEEGLYETGQAWFDAFYAGSLQTAESVSLEDLGKYHPVSKLLLDMTGEDQNENKGIGGQSAG